MLSLIFTAILLLLAYLWYDKYQKEQRLNWLKIPPGVPILGHALDFKSGSTILPTFDRYFREMNSNTVSLSILNRYFILVKDYDFLEFILSSNKVLNKSRDYKFLGNWLNTGLLTADADKWRPRRKIITPAFHFGILESFVEIFEANDKILVKNLEKELNKDSVNIYSYITLCALDIICETAMGVSVNAQSNSDSEYVQSVKNMCRILIDRAFSPLKQFDFLYQFSKDYKLEMKSLKILHGYTNSVINKRIDELKQKQQTSNQDVDNDVGVKRKKAFLDLLLQSTIDGKPLSKDDIREEVDTFMFEGHDTTASGMSFALYCLANNPEVQKRAFEEQVEIFGKDLHRPTTHQDLVNMKYLELVIKETLRMYPSVPFYGRVIHEDIEYKNIIIPQGSTFTAYIYGLNHDPKFYPEPEKFNPSRFEEPEGEHKRPFAYLAFSAGPRNCIGQKFAMLEMKCTLSQMLRNFELLPAIPEHKLVLAAETVLKSANGINIRLRKRIV